MTQQSPSRPNIIVILVDDLGFSDIGCYGSEIQTPNLDRLGTNGLRFSQMYNAARCCPSRAALLTGLYPHQAGVGHMVQDYGSDGYRGYLNGSCATVAEVLKGAGYRTMMSGKWHVGGHYHPPIPEEGWEAGAEGRPTPRQRGFDRFYGILGGYGSLFDPFSLMDDDTPIKVETPDYYFTDAITDHAIEYIGEATDMGDPFFLYASYTAPHWPLHAQPEDIEKYIGKYRNGWDELRTARHEELKGMGVLDSKWEISPRDVDAPAWPDAQHRDWEDIRMAVYAAMIDRVDQGVGRLLDKLTETDQLDNTLIMFLSDNGGDAELFMEDTDIPVPSVFAIPTVDGQTTRVGNIPNVSPGPANTFMSVDLPWANASNTPFRLFKRWIHEGGISTPFIVSWPAVIREGNIIHEPAHITDITATCIDAAGARYPTEVNGTAILPLEGESMLPAFKGNEWSREQPICWEHEGNHAIRIGEWKLVAEQGGDWELYNMDEDRTELNDLASGDKQRVDAMAKLYAEWAERCNVVPWPANPAFQGFRYQGQHAHVAGAPSQPIPGDR